MGARQSLGPVRLAAQHVDGPRHRHHQPRARGRAVHVGRRPARRRRGRRSLRPGTRAASRASCCSSIGMALTPFMTSGFGLIVSLGLLAAIGSGAGSFSVLIGAAAQRLAAGKARQGGGHHQRRRLVRAVRFRADLAEADPGARAGWARMWSLAVITLAALPLVRVVRADRRRRKPQHEPRDAAPWPTVRERDAATAAISCCTPASSPAAFTSRSSSRTCRGEVNLCGLPPTVASWSLAIIGLVEHRRAA